MVLLLPLLPLRLAIGGFSLVAIATINSLAAWNWPIDKPLTPWRRRVVLFSKELVLVTLWCLGFRVRVSGREHIRTAERLGAVAVFNHVSWVDAFVLVWLMAPSGVSKESNGRIPVIGQAVRALQTVYIPYEKLSKRHSSRTTPAAATAPTPASPAGTHGCAAAAAARNGAGGQPALSSPTDTYKASGSNDGSCSSSNDSDTSTNGSSNSGSGSSSTGSNSGKKSNNRGSSSSSSNGSTFGAAKCTAGFGAAGRVASAHHETRAAPGGGTQAAHPLLAPPPSSPPQSGHRGRAGVVTSNVTEVLLRRVSPLSYCQPGGFPMVVMAPEGTTANGRGLLLFRSGAFVLRRPVLPICLRYRWRGLNPAWTIGDVRWHFLRLMCQFRNDLEVEILPPYKPSEDEIQDCRLFASHVRRLMAAVLGVPLVAASHDDYLTLAARGVGLSWDGRRVTVRGGGSEGGPGGEGGGGGAGRRVSGGEVTPALRGR